MFSYRRIILFLLGAIVFGSFFTTEDLRPFSAQAGTSTEAQARAAIERLRERQHDLDSPQIPDTTTIDLPYWRAKLAEKKRTLERIRGDWAHLQKLAPALQRRARAGRTWWPIDIQPDDRFCTVLADFAAAVAQDRDAGFSLQESLQTREVIPDASLWLVMQAIILDLYTDVQITARLAHEITDILCRQGIPPQY